MTDREETRLDWLVAKTRRFVAENIGHNTLHLLGRLLLNVDYEPAGQHDLTAHEVQADEEFFGKLDQFLIETVGPDWDKMEAL